MLSRIRAYRGRLIVAAVVVAIPVLALAWWLGSPLFINQTVDEEFPHSVGAVVPEGMTRAQVDRTMETMSMMDDIVAETMPVMTPPEIAGAVVEELAEAVMTGDVTEMLAEGAMAEMGAEAMQAMVGMMAAGGAPEVVKRGMFRDADGFHKGEGSATLYTLPDGSHVLRFEDFRVTNGPDLRVLLASHPDPMSRGDVHSGEYVELAKLKGNIGNQNYPLPDGLSPDDYNSVVIYCKPFQVIFSVAPLPDG